MLVAYATYNLRDMKILGLLWPILVLVATQPIEKGNQMGAFQYLLNYGYIADDGNSDVAAAMSEDMIIQAIKDFQVSFTLLTPNFLLLYLTLYFIGLCWVRSYW